MENSREDSRNKISAGSYDLNKWLHGGYEKDIITTIYGPAGIGKTNFCLAAVASQLKRGGKVIFIDTEGGFSIERIRQIIQLKKLENRNQEKNVFEGMLENLILLKPTNFEEQWKAFGELLKELKSDRQKNISLIIVDGMTMLYRLELAEARKEKEDKERYEKIDEINSKLAKQMRLLAEIARKENIPIIITNQVYSDFLKEEEILEGKIKQVNMVGGDILKYWSKCLIELKKEKGKRMALLRKHRSLAESNFVFEIVESGIRKKGWL